MNKFVILVLSAVVLVKGLQDAGDSSCVASEKSQTISEYLTHSTIITKSLLDVNRSTNISSSHVELNHYQSGNGISLDVKGNSYEDDLLKTLSTKVLAISTPFDPSRSPSTSPKCKLHSKMFLESLKNFDLWALKMHDSSAKISSGILNGNINYFGDFDQCLNIQGPMDEFTGKYCLTYLQITVPETLPRHKYLHKLMQSHDAFKSEFDDCGHRVPRFSIVNWAVCVPSSCTPMDVQNSLKEYVHNFTLGTAIQTQIRVDPQMCQIKDIEPYDRNTLIAGAFFLTVIVISLLSTLIEYKVENPNPWLVAFSLHKNVMALIKLDRDPNDIESLHGIRFLNALLLLISHKSMALFFDPYINRTEMTETFGQPWTVIGRAAAIYTDVFLLFSGLLTAYSIVGRKQRNQSLRLKQEYIGRILRFAPTLGALILFCTYILPQLGSGPQWNLVVTHHSKICKEHWWKNMLFIHNYFGFSKMCLTHTHHIGIDTELFAVAPILILILYKWPKRGALFLLGLAGISTLLRFQVTVDYKLSNYVYFGTSIQRLFRTADYMYTLPIYRSTIYILGILLGYALRVFKDYKLTERQLKIGWYVSTVLFLAVFLGPAPMGSMTYVYNEYHAAIYAALGPMGWCGLFGWIVFTSHLGYESIPSKLLSWKGYLITTRLSYAIYLTQFPVFFYNVGRRRHSGYFEFLSYTANIHEYIWIVIASVALTLFFDTPFQNIKKIIFKAPSSQKPIVDSTNNQTVYATKKLL